ncbi:MAG TPA: hypothetical protein VN958_12835, partial [Chitinophagaceae bacterium]|nr:hypothetical protein [Chitinophagaceae bacterium]
KKWKEYFLEFLMIFLAVTMGFIAENIREHIVEDEREKKYMQSLLIDLKTDIIKIETVQKQNVLAKQVGDSLFLLLALPDHTNETNSIYYYGRLFSARTFFNMRDGTLKQLNNAGGLRLIHHQEIVDSLEAYQYTYAELLKLQELKEIQLLNYRDVMCKVFDIRILETMVNGEKITRPVGNPKLFSENKELLNELLMKAHFVKRNNAQLLTMLAEMKQMDMNLQTIINKENHWD